MRRLSKGIGAGSALAKLEISEDLVHGMLYRREHLATVALIGHLRPLLYIHIHIIWFITLKRLSVTSQASGAEATAWCVH